MADMLQLAGTKVEISIGYPLDTDTPGFANENLTKVCCILAVSTKRLVVCQLDLLFASEDD